MPLSSINMSHNEYLARQIRDLRRIAGIREYDAATVVGTVLSVWRSEVFPALTPAELPVSELFAAEKKVTRFVELLRTLDFLEATYWLSSLYAIVADKNYRKQLAMYFTPPSLTRGLLDDLEEQGVIFSSETFIDPACGGAAFLTPIALRIRDALADMGASLLQVLLHIEKHLIGTEKDPVLCELCKQFLCMALYNEITKTGHIPSFTVVQADSLTTLSRFFDSMDVVVCNPPYRKMKNDELDLLRPEFDEVIEGQCNLYGLFIGLCVRLLKKGGFAALVTPTSFLSGRDFRKLRTFLRREAEVVHIGMVSDRQGIFIDVEQETALTVVKRRHLSESVQTKSVVSVVSPTGQYRGVGECILPYGGSAWPIPRAIEDVALLMATAGLTFRISDYGYRARIGAYVWNRDKRPRFKSIVEVIEAKTSTALPLLWSSDISATGHVEFNDKAMAKEEHRFVDLGDKQHASAVLMPSVVLQRVTSNDQRCRLIAAPVSQHIYEEYGGFVGENHVVILEQVDQTPVLYPSEMAELLRTKVIDRSFRCISGATNVSIFELQQLPLPNPKSLRAELNKGVSMEAAARRVIGI